jgi:ribokinase
VEAVDTTGADDGLVDGFLTALSESGAYSDAARFANAVGALSVQKLGAVNGIRTRAESYSTVRMVQKSLARLGCVRYA